MKKIMVVLAVAICAVCANAATASWKLTAGNLKGASGGDYTGTFQLFASGADLASDLLVYQDSGKSSYSKITISDVAGFTIGEEYDFYYVISDGGKQLTSEIKKATAIAVGETAINWGNQATYTGTADNWTAVPEPTSALLMVLGIAGLALKRKRA